MMSSPTVKADATLQNAESRTADRPKPRPGNAKDELAEKSIRPFEELMGIMAGRRPGK